MPKITCVSVPVVSWLVSPVRLRPCASRVFLRDWLTARHGGAPGGGVISCSDLNNPEQKRGQPELGRRRSQATLGPRQWSHWEEHERPETSLPQSAERV